MDGKLKWASFMAQRKGLIFSVDDDTMASEEGIQAMHRQFLNESDFGGCMWHNILQMITFFGVCQSLWC